MTFPEFFNELYKYNLDEVNRDVFFSAMIRNFIFKDKEAGCKLLTFQSGTQTRYVQEDNPRPIDSKYIKYLSINHDKQRFIEWISKFMEDTDSSDYIETWLIENGMVVKDVAKSCNNLLEGIFYAIAYPDEYEEPIELPPEDKSSDDSETGWSEHDNALVADFNADYDEVIQICIGERYAQEYLTGRLTKKINTLYNSKWKEKSAEFENILLKADVLTTLGTLQELCDALNPSIGPKPGLSVRMIRTELRNRYIKLHPNGYAGIYPYEVAIDDWNDTEEHFEFEL